MANPAYNRIEKDAQSGYAGFGGQPSPSAQSAAAAQATTAGMTAQQLQDLYNQPTATPVQTRRVTMDDVIMKTLGLFAIVLVTGAVGWTVSAASPSTGMALWFGGMIGTLVLGLVIAFKKTLSVPLILLYAVVEGLFVGAVSQYFNEVYPGIVGAGGARDPVDVRGHVPRRTRSASSRSRPKFRRIVTMMIFGYAIFAHRQRRLRGRSPTAVRLRWERRPRHRHLALRHRPGSFMLALDFDSIEQAIRSGAPQQYSWLLAHGLIVTLVWLYIEFLRLFARLRE